MRNRFNKWLRSLGALLGLVGIPSLLAGAGADGSYTVPIYHAKNGGQHVLHVYASINGGTAVPYLLDSGSPNFFSTYAASWWPGSPNSVVVGTEHDTFSSGNEFFYNGAVASVSFSSPQQNAIVTLPNATVAMLTQADVNGTLSDYTQWQAVNPATQTALPNGTFGNMGLGLEGNRKVAGLATLAAQIPIAPGMKTGFVVNTGGSVTSDASLILGLSPDVVSLFQSPSAIVLQMQASGVIPGPNGTWVPAYGEAQATYTVLTVTRDGHVTVLALPTIFDTGGGNNTYIADDGTVLDRGHDYQVDGILVQNNLQTVFDYIHTNPLNGGLSVITGGGSDPRTNTGLSIFLQYVVLFNLSDGWMSLLPFGALNQLPFLSNAFTPASSNFTVNGTVTTGPAPVTVNSLQFLPSANLQVRNLLTVTSGEFTVPSGTASLNGGSVTTPGNFNKLGGGTLITDAAISVNGAANVHAGGLVVNQSLTAPQELQVFPGAWLGGSGTLYTNVVNRGSIQPGNSPGMLTVVGNYTQTSVGALTIEVQSSTVLDQLIVSGTANLAGTLSVVPYQSTFQYGQLIPNFLQAGQIVGGFETINVPEGFRARVIQNGGNLSILLAPSSYTVIAQTQNQWNVARALDTFIQSAFGDRFSISFLLDFLNDPTVFDQISPAFYETLTDTTIEQYVTQGQMLIQRLSSVQLGAPEFQQMGMSFPEYRPPSESGSTEGERPIDLAVEFPWSSWVQGNGIFSNHYNVANLPGYRSAAGGILVGADRNWAHGFLTGLYAGYQGSYSDYANGSQAKMNGARFGVYAAWQPGPSGFYANTALGGGVSSYSVQRKIQIAGLERTAQSEPTGGEVATWLNIGYDWQIGRFTLGPLTNLQYTYVGIAPFTENGAESLDLGVGQQNANSLRATFGGRIAYTAQMGEQLKLIPEFRMGWQHEFLQNPTSFSATLDGGSGPTFDYSPSAPARDAAWAGIGLTLQMGSRWNANVWFNSSFGRNDYTSQSISGGLGVSF